MVARVLKRIAARMPPGVQQELRRQYFGFQIRTHRFYTDEQEYRLIDTFLREGDWALDIGANVGHYALRMSQVVGPSGRVIAVEPVPETFALLASNARLFPYRNVTLLNVAASDRTAAVDMAIPAFDVGLLNYYQAHLTAGEGALGVLTMPVDALHLPGKVGLVKVDVEGHELPVLKGMRSLLERDRPALIVETGARETVDFLEAMGYEAERIRGSGNVVCVSARELAL